MIFRSILAVILLDRRIQRRRADRRLLDKMCPDLAFERRRFKDLLELRRLGATRKFFDLKTGRIVRR